jgi:hypothetical protein
LAWRHGVYLGCFSSSVDTINAWCYVDPPNKPRLLTFIYGPPEKINKSIFWDSLLNEGKDYYGHWLCIGDFNVILSQFEYFGICLLLVRRIIPFIAFWIPLVWLI